MNVSRFCLLAWLLTSQFAGCAALGPVSPLRPLEERIVYAAPPRPKSASVPTSVGEDVWFDAEDGVALNGRYFEHPQSRAVALFCHGNAGSLEMWGDVGRQLSERHQLSVLVFDYRGYGYSAGSPNEAGILQDGVGARRWLAKRAGVRASDVVLIGRSLGGAVAVDLAARGGARGLILENTFSSLPDVAAEHASWMLPHIMMTQRLNSAKKIRDYQGPLLQCHGDADRLIPLSVAKKLFEAAPGRKRLVVMPGADHNDPPSAEYEQAFDEFIDALPPVQSASAN